MNAEICMFKLIFQFRHYTIREYGRARVECVCEATLYHSFSSDSHAVYAVHPNSVLVLSSQRDACSMVADYNNRRETAK